MEYQVLRKQVHVEALVKSETHEGAYYKVAIHAEEDKESYECTCPAQRSIEDRMRNGVCKHINAVKEGLGAFG